MRLAQGQIWRIVADRPHCFRQDVARQGRQEIGKSYEGDASNA